MEKGLSYFFGMLVSVAVSLGLVLLFALVVQAFTLGDVAVRIVNQAIKIMAIFFGVKFSIKTKGALKGGIFGLVFAIITLIIFSILSSSTGFDLSVAFEILFCIAVGSLCGIIAVQLNN